MIYLSEHVRSDQSSYCDNVNYFDFYQLYNLQVLACSILFTVTYNLKVTPVVASVEMSTSARWPGTSRANSLKCLTWM